MLDECACGCAEVEAVEEWSDIAVLSNCTAVSGVKVRKSGAGESGCWSRDSAVFSERYARRLLEQTSGPPRQGVSIQLTSLRMCS